MRAFASDAYRVVVNNDGTATLTLRYTDEEVPLAEEPRLSLPAKSYDHEARLGDDEANTCRDCGDDVTWVGPGVEDYLHVDDRRNR